MPTNDELLLKSHFDHWMLTRGAGLSATEPFTIYCIEQFLKEADIFDNQLQNGVTEGGNDGGIDAAYLFVRDLLIDDAVVLDPKGAGAEIRIVLFQIKNTAGGHSPIEIGKVRDFLDDLLDLSQSTSSFKAIYNKRIRQFMENFKKTYEILMSKFPQVTIDYYYITKGTSSPDKAAKLAIGKAEKIVRKHLTDPQCIFNCINLRGLLTEVSRRAVKDRALKWVESPMETKEGYVGLVSLWEYYNFLMNEHGDLNEHLLEPNVRGYLRGTPVNKDIRDTLAGPRDVNFWVLNNGITILAAKTGKAGHLAVSLSDPKIVNGLQTSRELFEYFLTKPKKGDPRSILVRVIETGDSDLQDSIIRATNRQNSLPKSSLRGTDTIQQKIDTTFLAADMFYDRKRGFYRDQGKPIAKIVSMTALTQAVLAIVVQLPNEARARPSSFITDDAQYKKIFSDEYPLQMYLKCSQLMQAVDTHLRSNVNLEGTDRSNVIYYVLTLVACQLTKKRKPTPQEISEIDLALVTTSLLKSSFKRVWKIYIDLGGDDAIAKSAEMTRRLTQHINRSRGVITG